jgi:hypothetical protein
MVPNNNDDSVVEDPKIIFCDVPNLAGRIVCAHYLKAHGATWDTVTVIHF